MKIRLFLRDEKAEAALPNYYSILNGRRKAKYLMAKYTPIPEGLDGSEEELLERHNSGLESMTELDPEIDDLSKLEFPQFSLLDLKFELAGRYFKNCNYCERMCKVDRTEKKGTCGVMESRVCSEFLHWGEEPELVPSYTIFFAGCTFKCVFCQNWDISQFPGGGVKIKPDKLARMIESQAGNARNTNWVGGDPTSNLKYILDVLRICSGSIAQVWNSNMYLTESSMQLLDGLIDVYLTDFKYGPGGCAKRLSKVNRYWDVTTRNHKLANDQTEMIIRHLVLPNHIECCSKPVLKWIAGSLDTSRVRVNIMAQYHPDYNAHEHDELTRKLKTTEFIEAVAFGKELGLNLVR